jgi:Immunoglobulin-like domain of bacterial spore germination/Sporulation and spore germination
MRSAAIRAGLLALVVFAAGCGGADDETSGNPPSPPPPPPPPATSTEGEPVGGTTVGVYFVRDDKLAYAERSVGVTPQIPNEALEEVLAGPTAEEIEAGLTSDIPPTTKIASLKVEGGRAIVALSNPLDRLGSAQVVQTLTQLETVESVQLGQEEFTSADTEEALPAILVESPAIGATVTSPLTIRGTANTFEATFMVELRPEHGTPLYKDFVTASSGNGMRGTFEKTIDFTVDRQRPGTLVVYENSAEDGAVMNEVEIPVTIQP